MLVDFLLLGWFAVCGYQDLTRLRVSNLLTLGGALIAAAFLLVTGHTLTGHPPMAALVATLLALVLSVPGYLLGKLGAADVKALVALALASNAQLLLHVWALASLISLLLMFASKLLMGSDWLKANFQTQLARLLPSRLKSFPFIFSLFAGLLAYISFFH
ncbi:prepilin peptidase [Pseudomonas sp. SCB32]|uniref:prepilin peptidase n=1 Tax=Pseudomonas sp. SCB32 TaxID=2653853 RepID=UPI0012644F5D|nr:prepilin peptidase [Pseudomonas sp. SCB32]